MFIYILDFATMVQSISKNLPDSTVFYRVQGTVPSWIKPTSQNLMFTFEDKPISTATKLPTSSTSITVPIPIKILAKTVEDDKTETDSLLSKFWSFSVTETLKNLFRKPCKIPEILTVHKF